MSSNHTRSTIKKLPPLLVKMPAIIIDDDDTNNEGGECFAHSSNTPASTNIFLAVDERIVDGGKDTCSSCCCDYKNKEQKALPPVVLSTNSSLALRTRIADNISPTYILLDEKKTTDECSSQKHKTIDSKKLVRNTNCRSSATKTHQHNFSAKQILPPIKEKERKH